jgi:hypothetical protein
MRSVKTTLTMGSEVRVRLGIDHGQFIARDSVSVLDIESYDDDAIQHGLAIWDSRRGITVFTASSWSESEVTLRLSAVRPVVTAEDWDHVVEGGLVIESGCLHVYGPEDTGTNEAMVNVPSDSYSLLVCGRAFDSTNEYGDDGRDTYALLLWPGSPLRRRVLKNGFSRHG